MLGTVLASSGESSLVLLERNEDFLFLITSSSSRKPAILWEVFSCTALGHSWSVSPDTVLLSIGGGSRSNFKGVRCCFFSATSSSLAVTRLPSSLAPLAPAPVLRLNGWSNHSFTVSKLFGSSGTSSARSPCAEGGSSPDSDPVSDLYTVCPI